MPRAFAAEVFSASDPLFLLRTDKFGKKAHTNLTRENAQIDLAGFFDDHLCDIMHSYLAPARASGATLPASFCASQ